MTKAPFLLVVSILICFLFLACGEDKLNTPITIADDSTTVTLAKEQQLPERTCAYSKDSSWIAYYNRPTERYRHGILGDRIEGGGFTLINDNIAFDFVLPENYVFEDLTPRLVDLDGDNIPEIVCIRAELSLGASLVIYKINKEKIEEYAWIPEIGIPNRWLNPVAITDLNQDGVLDLFWIQTPHIGGILKVASIAKGEMEVLDSYSGVSNHAIGSRNLCLSAMLLKEDILQIIIPNQSRDKTFYFSYNEESLIKTSETVLEVDFDLPLSDQLEDIDFLNDNNCLFAF